MMQILAILPLALIFFLILVFKWPPLKAMASALFVLILIVIFAWQMHPNWIFASGLKGFLFALEIGLIIIGAVFFLSILKMKGLQEKIKTLIQNISQDRRVQVIIIAWAFTALIEGSAGFGTPAILASAILITLGFSVIPAVTLSLIGAALHTPFGAVGTPIIFGFGAGLEPAFLAFLPEVTSSIAFYNIFIGFFVCLIMLIMLVFVFGKKQAKQLKYVLEIIPFLMVASLLVTGPAWLLAHYFGPELPSLVGGLVGLFLLLIIAQKSWFLPKTNWDFNKITEVKTDQKSKSVSFLNISQILLPYFFLALIVFISRADFFPVETWLMSPYLSFSLTQIFKTEINYSFSPLYALGILLFLSGMILALFFKQSLVQIKTAFNQSLQKTKSALLVLIIILVFVQIFIYSGENLNNYQSMPLLLATSAADISGKFFLFFVPLIGTLGSFITGSTTVSNLLFGNFQANSALILGADPKLFLSLQSIGAALGNMIALHNIIVVLAIVGQISKVGLIIKYNLLIILFLCLFLGLIGFLIR
ncbi:L-lactate permease [Dehalococcoidia bacterium]|nr:L-lactate permease [Dehalococcoidia bacterium]